MATGGYLGSNLVYHGNFCGNIADGQVYLGLLAIDGFCEERVGNFESIVVAFDVVNDGEAEAVDMNDVMMRTMVYLAAVKQHSGYIVVLDLDGRVGFYIHLSFQTV